MKKKRCSILLIALICSLLLSGCNFELSPTDTTNLTDRVRETIVREGGTDGEKEYTVTWTKDALEFDEIGAEKYNYFLYPNQILLKIPNNKLYAELYTDAVVNNPAPGAYVVDSYEKKFVMTFKEIVEHEHFYRLAVVSQNEVVETTREEELYSGDYNLNWLVFSEEQIDTMTDAELTQAYKNLRYFEAYYRTEILHEILVNSTSEIDYDDIISFKDAFPQGSYDDTIESFLFNAYSGEEEFHNWIKYMEDLEAQRLAAEAAESTTDEEETSESASEATSEETVSEDTASVDDTPADTTSEQMKRDAALEQEAAEEKAEIASETGDTGADDEETVIPPDGEELTIQDLGVDEAQEQVAQLSEDEAREIMKKYLLNVKMVNNTIQFIDVNMFFDITYLDDEINIPKNDVRDTQHIDAYNRPRR